MSDLAVKINLITTADGKGVDETKRALDQVGTEATQAERKVESLGDEFEQSMAAAKAAVAGAEAKLHDLGTSAGEAGQEAGRALSDGLSTGSKSGGLTGGIGAVMDVSASVQEAWQLGTEIGGALWGAIERTMEDGLSWESILGKSAATQEAEDTAQSISNAIAAIKATHADLVQQLESTPDNATKWLDEINEKSKRALDAMQALTKIQSAKESAAQQIGNSALADRKAAIQASDLPKEEKAKQMAEAEAEHAKFSLSLRERSRQTQNETLGAKASGAQREYVEKDAAAGQQRRRAEAAQKADAEAEAYAANYAGNPEHLIKEQRDGAYQRSLKAQGFDPASFGDAKTEQQAKVAADKAAKDAAAKARQAALERDTTAATNGIASGADQQITASTISRTLAAGQRPAEQLKQQAGRADAADRTAEAAKSLENATKLVATGQGKKGAEVLADAIDKLAPALQEADTRQREEIFKLKGQIEKLASQIKNSR